MKRSKTWVWFVVVAATGLLLLIIWQRDLLRNYGKKGGSKPHVSVKEIKIHDIGEDKITMTARVMVSNPLLIELTVDSLTCELSIDSITVIQSSYTRGVRIKSLDSAMVVLPLTIDRSRLHAVFERFERKHSDSANYMVKATLYIDPPLGGEKKFSRHKIQRGPAIHPLKLAAEDHRIEKFGFRHSEVTLSLLVQNPNVFEVSIKDIGYDLRVGQDLAVTGTAPGTMRIPPHGTISIPLDLDVHTRNIVRLTWQAVFEKKHTPFAISMRCRIVTDNDAFKGTRLRLTRKGKLSELKQALPR